MSIHRIGILGAGRAGTALARAAASGGLEVTIAASRPPRMLKYHLAQYAPKAHAVDATEIANGVDLVVLMVPQEDLDDLEPAILAGTVVVDATNRWQDEPLPHWLEDALERGLSSSEGIAKHFAESRIVKSLNHISHWDIDADRASKKASQRALAIASDLPEDATKVAELIELLGFRAVRLPRLADGRPLEPGSEIFNEVLSAEELTARINAYKHG